MTMYLDTYPSIAFSSEVNLINRRLGATDLEISEIGFAMSNLTSEKSVTLHEKDAILLLNESIDLGINFFDAADIDGLGYGEEVLGKTLGKKRNQMNIATKFGYDFYSYLHDIPNQRYPQNFSASFVKYACEQSLRRLNTDHIDLYQVHDASLETVSTHELLDVLDRLIIEGKIRYYGSCLNPDMMTSETCEKPINVKGVRSLQLTYSIFEQELANRRILDTASRQGMGIIANMQHSPGLTYTPEELDTYLRTRIGEHDVSQTCLERDHEILDSLNTMALETGLDIAQMDIQFVLKNSIIASVLPGITNQAQLKKYASYKLTSVLDSMQIKQIIRS